MVFASACAGIFQRKNALNISNDKYHLRIWKLEEKMIIAPTPQGIAEACRLLKEGQVIGMPTETVYGLAGDAYKDTAVARIF